MLFIDLSINELNVEEALRLWTTINPRIFIARNTDHMYIFRHQVKGKKKQLFKNRKVYSPEHGCSYQPLVHIGSTKAQSNYRQTDTNGQSIDKKVEKEIGDQIRVRLDENLDRVYHILRHKNNTPNSQHLNPTIQNSLLHQYIRLIYQDYSIPDPMGKSSNIHSSPFKGQRFSNIQNTRSSEKQQESYIVQMFSPSHTPSSPSIKFPLKKMDNRRTSCEITEEQKRDYEIESVYRYCFVCEEPVLEANIDIHERNCRSFCSVYTLGLKEIKESIVSKVTRIRNELEELWETCLENEAKGEKIKKCLKKEIKNYLFHVDLGLKNKVNEEQNNSLKYSFNSVINCYDQNYFKIYENAKKLQWFSLMLKNINQKYPEKENSKCKDLTGSIIKSKENSLFPIEGGQRRHSLAH